MDNVLAKLVQLIAQRSGVSDDDGSESGTAVDPRANRQWLNGTQGGMNFSPAPSINGVYPGSNEMAARLGRASASSTRGQGVTSGSSNNPYDYYPPPNPYKRRNAQTLSGLTNDPSLQFYQ
jgi:hypothetical protein